MAKQAQHIIADPFAQETGWLPACALVGTKVSASPARALPLLRLAAAVMLSLLVSSVGPQAVNLGYDWGYKLVEQFFGQPASNQGIGALLALPFIIAPLFFGLTLGCLKQLCSGSQSWTVAGIVAVFCFLLRGELSASSLSTVNLQIICFSLLFYLAGFALSGAVSKRMHTRLRLDRVVVTSLCSLVLTSVAPYLIQTTQTNLNWLTELAIYFCLLAMGAAQAARSARARSRTGAVLIAMLASSPFMLANLLNMFATSISFVMDHFGMGLNLGWRAILSASLISVASAFASTAGGLGGFLLRSENKIDQM